MHKSIKTNLKWFNWQAKIGQYYNAIRENLYQQNHHWQWSETPNFYKEKDLGFKEILGQRVKVKQVMDTSGTKFFVISDDFSFSGFSV